MNVNDHVYALQALKFWLDDMHRENFERATTDPDNEEFMMQVSGCYYDLLSEYEAAYDPNTNMIHPDLLRWEGWQELNSWPKELETYLPANKLDVEKVKALMKLPFETLEPCLPIVLTWLQDINWPIAAMAVKRLRELKGKLVPALLEALIMARQTRDHFWTYNLVQQLIEELSTEDIRQLEEELCRMVNSEDEEVGVKALVLLAKHNLWNNEMTNKWAKIKRNAYAEWVAELDEIIEERTD